jgi:ATP-dependent Clp protease ATP-binding subunit ClpA
MEKARRVLFFARYEASQLGSAYVEPGHVLLGLLREDKPLVRRFVGSHREVEDVRKQIVDLLPVGDRISTSVDLPLSQSSRAVLARAERERVRAGVAMLETSHLLIGLLQEQSPASEILRARGLTLEKVREEIEKESSAVPVREEKKHKPTACKDCRHLVDGDLSDRNMFCVASPKEPAFDYYKGEFKELPDQPGELIRGLVFMARCFSRICSNSA